MEYSQYITYADIKINNQDYKLIRKFKYYTKLAYASCDGGGYDHRCRNDDSFHVLYSCNKCDKLFSFKKMVISHFTIDPYCDKRKKNVPLADEQLDYLLSLKLDTPEYKTILYAVRRAKGPDKYFD